MPEPSSLSVSGPCSKLQQATGPRGSSEASLATRRAPESVSRELRDAPEPGEAAASTRDSLAALLSGQSALPSASDDRPGFTVTRSPDGQGRPHAGRELSNRMAPAKVAPALEEAAVTQAVTQGTAWAGSGCEDREAPAHGFPGALGRRGLVPLILQKRRSRAGEVKPVPTRGQVASECRYPFKPRFPPRPGSRVSLCYYRFRAWYPRRARDLNVQPGPC